MRKCKGLAHASEVGVRTGRDDVVILVEAGTTIEGRVLDQDDAPITTGWVSAVSQNNNNRRNRWGGNNRWSRIGSDGTFKLSGLEPGAHTVTASGSFVAEPAQGVDIEAVVLLREHDVEADRGDAVVLGQHLDHPGELVP